MTHLLKDVENRSNGHIHIEVPSTTTADIREMVLWCHSNIEFDWVPLGLMTRSEQSCWYFESEEDSMAFKLTWL